MRCDHCERGCELGEGRPGFCGMYEGRGGWVRERFPGLYSACVPSAIEAMPFYHAYPGTRTLAFGTFGCNFRCRYCANAAVAFEDPARLAPEMIAMAPADLVREALRRRCQSLVFNVNEPTVSLPGLAELKRHADGAGLPMGCLTNAYGTERSTERLASVFSFVNVSLKGLAPAFCRDRLGIPDAAPVLRNLRRLAALRHVEVTTPVVEGENDGDLDAIASFLAGVDPEIPWHVFRLLPEHQMRGAPRPDIGRLDERLGDARGKLAHVYLHNFVGSDWVDTRCPGCGAPLVERVSLGCGGDRLRRYACGPGGACPGCGRRVRMLGEGPPAATPGGATA